MARYSPGPPGDADTPGYVPQVEEAMLTRATDVCQGSCRSRRRTEADVTDRSGAAELGLLGFGERDCRLCRSSGDGSRLPMPTKARSSSFDDFDDIADGGILDERTTQRGAARPAPAWAAAQACAPVTAARSPMSLFACTCTLEVFRDRRRSVPRGPGGPWSWSAWPAQRRAASRVHDDTPRTSPPVSVACRYCAVAAPSAGITWPLAPSASTMTASLRQNFRWILSSRSV